MIAFYVSTGLADHRFSKAGSHHSFTHNPANPPMLPFVARPLFWPDSLVAIRRETTLEF